MLNTKIIWRHSWLDILLLTSVTHSYIAWYECQHETRAAIYMVSVEEEMAGNQICDRIWENPACCYFRENHDRIICTTSELTLRPIARSVSKIQRPLCNDARTLELEKLQSKCVATYVRGVSVYPLFVHKSLQNFQLAVKWRYESAVRLPIRKPGQSRWKWFTFEEAFIYPFITYFFFEREHQVEKNAHGTSFLSTKKPHTHRQQILQ